MFFSALLGGGLASAEPIRLSYDAPADCPNEEQFRRRVLERVTRGDPASVQEFARTYAVRVEQSEPAYRGSVTFRKPDEEYAVREVRGASCAAVVDALVVVTALAIDANAMEIEPEAPLPAAPTTAPPAESESPPGPPPGPAPISPPPPGFDAPPPRATTEPARWTLGAVVAAKSAFTPTLALGGGAFFELESTRRWSGRLTASYADSGPVERRDRAARFALAGGSLDGCHPGLRLGIGELTTCAAVEVGATRAEGERTAGVESVRSAWDPWVSLAALARFRLPIADRLEMHADAAMVFPLTRRTFSFETPDIVVYRVPLVAWAAGFGASYRFP